MLACSWSHGGLCKCTKEVPASVLINNTNHCSRNKYVSIRFQVIHKLESILSGDPPAPPETLPTAVNLIHALTERLYHLPLQPKSWSQSIASWCTCLLPTLRLHFLHIIHKWTPGKNTTLMISERVVIFTLFYSHSALLVRVYACKFSFDLFKLKG